MNEQKINEAVEKVLKNKTLRNNLNIDKTQAYDLRHRSGLGTKLELLYHAGYLKLNEPTSKEITTQ